jgi:glycosyltransferase involved in cell wall biosynthesis
MGNPLVSVITPTWQRPALLAARCIPSVLAQTYRPYEHIVVSDGPGDGVMAAASAVVGWYAEHPDADPDGADFVYDELAVHPPHKHWGNVARRRGLSMAKGGIIAYLDDDDAYRPEHLAVLVPVLLESGCDFVYSQMLSRMTGETLFGTPTPTMGHIGTPMLVHHKGLLDVATWGADDAMEDWHLVKAWVDAGATYQFVAQPTVDVWPSTFHAHA